MKKERERKTRRDPSGLICLTFEPANAFNFLSPASTFYTQTERDFAYAIFWVKKQILSKDSEMAATTT